MFGKFLGVLGLSDTAPREDDESDDSEASIDSFRRDDRESQYNDQQQTWNQGNDEAHQPTSSSSSSSSSSAGKENEIIEISSDEDGKTMIDRIVGKPAKRKAPPSKENSSSSRRKPAATPSSPQNSVGAGEFGSGSESESPPPQVVLNVNIRTLSVSATSKLLSCGKQPPVSLSISLPQTLFSNANTAEPSITIKDFIPKFVGAVAAALDLVAGQGVKAGEHTVSSLDFTSMAAIKDTHGAMVALSTLSAEGKYSHSSFYLVS